MRSIQNLVAGTVDLLLPNSSPNVTAALVAAIHVSNEPPEQA
jgi:hypothetical protein